MKAPRPSQRLQAAATAHDAALYDAQVVPRYSVLFGRMLLPEIPTDARMTVLDLGCGTGYPALDVMRRLPEGSRVIAIDPDPLLLDVARTRALDEVGRKIFFKAESAEQLSFGDAVFDLAIGNLALSAFVQPERALLEVRCVLKKDGRLLLTLPMEGTVEEVLDMFRELALTRDQPELAQRAERIAARYPSPRRLEGALEAAGFSGVEVRTAELGVPFGSAMELATDPFVRLVALPEWRWIAGFEPGGEQLLGHALRALDTYFGHGPLTLRVHAGLARASA